MCILLYREVRISEYEDEIENYGNQIKIFHKNTIGTILRQRVYVPGQMSTYVLYLRVDCTIGESPILFFVYS